jgi:hypothetical protein
MLALDSSEWGQLRHAGGCASDVPALLEAIASPGPANRHWDGPWHQLWERLCPQDNVFTASYAALPHLVRLAAFPEIAMDCLALAAAIGANQYEARAPAIPAMLRAPYLEAVNRIPRVLVELCSQPWSSDLTRCACAALAMSRGEAKLALSLLEGHTLQKGALGA